MRGVAKILDFEESFEFGNGAFPLFGLFVEERLLVVWCKGAIDGSKEISP